VIGATVVTAGLFLLVLAMLLRSRRRPVITGGEALIGTEGATIEWSGTEGTVRVKGEVWHARAVGTLQPGERVRVVSREGLVLTVEPN
jgi:membrane-bound serine protease (ClpP class)